MGWDYLSKEWGGLFAIRVGGLFAIRMIRIELFNTKVECVGWIPFREAYRYLPSILNMVGIFISQAFRPSHSLFRRNIREALFDPGI